MIRDEQGHTLIEFIIFVVVIGVLASIGLLGLQASLRNAPNIQNATTSIALAQQRMEFIIGQRNIYGFVDFVDPCPPPTSSTSPLCVVPDGFTITSSIITTAADTKTITVNAVNDAGLYPTTLEELVLNN